MRNDQEFHRGIHAGARAALAGLALLAALPAYAQSASADVSVTMTILSKNVCKFTSTPAAALPFGNINPGSTVPATVSIGAVFECKGSAPSATFAVTASNGAFFSGTRRMRHVTSTTSFLPYSLTVSPATATVAKNTPVNLTITGSVAVADFRDAIEGLYFDSVTVSVVP